MPAPALAAAIDIGAGLIACFGTWALIPVLQRTAVIDRPNERSSHAVPTPRGGGIALIAAVLFAWIALIAAGIAPSRLWLVLSGATLLAAVSWLDDLRGLSPVPRLFAQIAAVILGVVSSQIATGALFQGWLPAWLDTTAAAVVWVWFVNLYNFMDGIDGLAGSEAAMIAIGLVLFASFGVGENPSLAALAGAVALAAIGFLVWNWAPARIFLGDVGSVPLGYLLGFLLLEAAARGHWQLALMLPLYFLADATITLLRRLWRGERIWQAHRQHFYQRAVRRGLGHAAVTGRVIMANVLLIGCAWAVENGAGLYALSAGVIIVAVLLGSLTGMGRSHAALR